MRRYFFFLVFLVLALTVIVAYTVSEGPHNFSESECMDCHIDAEREPSRLIDSETRLCAKCHKRTIRAASHPVDIVPRLARIPSDMPLRGGRIVCSTCHNVHGDATLVFGIRSFFLRRPTSDMKFFCLTCHEENQARPGHRELVTVAHIGGQYLPIDPNEPLDPLSIQCIGCHDGSSATAASYSLPVLTEGIWMHSSGEGHPIGVHYRTARMKRKELAPISELPRQLRFFSGRVGCCTCHDPYSSLPGRLVMSNEESRLCLACHTEK